MLLTMEKVEKTVPLSFRLHPALKAGLQKLAEADRRSLTNYIEVLLEKHLEEKKKLKHG